MTITKLLYSLLIGPLELLFEFIFAMANRVFGNPGLNIMVLSLVMNFLVLPLYKQADEMQAQERDLEAKLQPWVSHIKKNFQGDERYMILQTYYRQNHYKPAYALRGTVSLLLEIPFFMAAYNMLSGLSLLHGASFGPIRDLGAPDAMIAIGGLTLNLLPILMTAINLITSAMYTRGFPLKSKIQLYGMALIFLVLLYDSPSGLVFYWTLNNVFSLCKTIFYKLRNPGKVFHILSSAAGVLGLCFVWFIHRMPTMRSQILVTAVLLVFQLPAAASVLLKKFPRNPLQTDEKADKKIFFGSCVLLTVLVGVLIPSSLLQSSPEEFVNLLTLRNPLWYLLQSGTLAAGTFLIWLVIFYRLASPRGKKSMTFLTAAAAVGALADYLFFGNDYGMMTAGLFYDGAPVFAAKAQLQNLLLLAALTLIVYLVFKFKAGLLKGMLPVICVALAAMSALNVFKIHNVVTGHLNAVREPLSRQVQIPVSKQGKNVMVIMMDRALGAQVPYILAEKPELKDQFAGFTYYPNTISYGPATNVGTPPLFGGYEYRPEEMNRRHGEKLEKKHNEAMMVMPVLFDSHDFNVTVCDPSYAGYRWIPDIRIYEDYPEIKTYLTKRNDSELLRRMYEFSESCMFHNLFCYGLFRAGPVAMQPYLYDRGTYNDPQILYAQEGDYVNQTCEGTVRAHGYMSTFMTSYRVLEHLTDMMDIRESQENTFWMISNETTHEPMLLQEPRYEPAPEVDNASYDAAHEDRFTLEGRTMAMDDLNQVTHYHVNMASFLELGKWLDYLRENDVYDNTRIIIAADHGAKLRQFEDMYIDEEGDVENFNPLLMVKDFGSREFTVDHRFMTQADVPLLAVQGLIEQPVNPFTGKMLTDAGKQGQQHVFFTRDWDVLTNNGTRFLPGIWYGVDGMTAGDDLLKGSSWQRIEDPSAE